MIAFNRKAIQLTRELIRFKTRVLNLQVNCQIAGFNFPLLIVHIRREALRFTEILIELNQNFVPGRPLLKRNIALDEVFWTQTMAEHAKFIVHLLDPSQNRAIEQAGVFAELFDALNLQARRIEQRATQLPTDRLIQFSRSLVTPTVQIRNFKANAERLVANCDLLILASPLLLDHVRREANKFIQDLDDHIEDLRAVKLKV